MHIENKVGEQFDSDELYWDEKNGKVYSERTLRFKDKTRNLKVMVLNRDQK